MARFSGSTYSASVDESKRLIALAMLGITKYDFDKTTNKLTLYMQDGTVVEAALTADSSSGEQNVNLQSLIDDTTITTTKTNSSSKIHADIQAAIAECKDDTLKQIAKKVSGSYKIATSTTEITSADHIYLINNGSNYDLYVLVEGNPTKVGDTSIDLSDYAKLTDLDNYYDKSASDGKFATITTVDDKIDKTSILSATSSTATDEQVYSAKVINTELKAVTKEIAKEVYSTNEQVVGTWVDGKPIYEKTMFSTFKDYVVGNFTVFSIALDNVNIVVSIDGMVNYDSIFPVPVTYNYIKDDIGNIQRITTYYDKRLKTVQTAVYVSTNTRYANAKYFVTIRYTKTTD